MNTIAAGHIIKLIVVNSVLAQLGLNIRHYVCSGISGGTVTVQQFATAMGAILAPFYKALMSEDATHSGVLAQRIFPTLGGFFAAFGETGPGDEGGGPMPTQVTGLITLRTNAGGRGTTGRVYVPFPAVADGNAFGHPDTGYVAFLQDLADELALPREITNGVLDTADMAPIVWHRSSSTYDIIEEGTASTRFATQRSRGGYGATNPV